MLAARLIRDDAAVHRAAGVEPIKDRAVPGVEDEEVPVQLAREHQVGRGQGDRGEHRTARLVPPADRAGRGVDRGEPAAPLLDGIGREAPAHVVLSGDSSERLGPLESAAPVHRGDVEHVGSRVVGGPVPLHAAERAGADVDALRRQGQLDVLATGDGDLVEVLARPPVQDMEQPIDFFLGVVQAE